MLLDVWDQGDFVGVLGFSQGSRLAHIISLLHLCTSGTAFKGLKFIVHVSGYGDCPLPDNLSTYFRDEWGIDVSSEDLESKVTNLPSLHVIGDQDQLIPPRSSLELMKFYNNASRLNHPGGHHVPVKAGDMQKYLSFFKENAKIEATDLEELLEPDSEHEQTQIDEVVALSQIFPLEFQLLSTSTLRDNADPADYSEDGRTYQHPIRYSILLQSQEDSDFNQKLWPTKQISLSIQYPPDYPDSSPKISLVHSMNYLEFSMQQSDALMSVIRDSMTIEIGMPCVMGMIYAAREFFENGGLALAASASLSIKKVNHQHTDSDDSNHAKVALDEDMTSLHASGLTSLKPCSAKRISECNDQGLQIAYVMLRSTHSDDVGDVNSPKENGCSAGKGGSWKYTIGLVGKPSAGKSTFFNAATAFARQRGAAGGAGNRDGTTENDIVLDGAAMAPHPFTTIDPNVGFCLVPAPPGSCPEDAETGRDELKKKGLVLGSTHGRDSKGRRLISLCLKDVAGLVPGAYQGRGKGNKVSLD
jgi:hypothetical protein